MAIYGRKSVPGDAHINSVGGNVGKMYDRTMRAQVTHSDKDTGIITVNYDGVPAKGGKQLTVPPLWASFPENGNPAWGRFMPQTSDLVRVSYGLDNSPYVVGYDVVGAKADLHTRGIGYAGLFDHQVKGISGSYPTFTKYSKFIPLNPGEYDFMSSGGAYIYGNDAGNLHFAGGSAFLTLIRDTRKLDTSAQNFTFTADNSKMQFGQARRTGPDGVEQPVLTSAIEYSVHMYRPDTGMAVGYTKLGDVIDGEGLSVYSDLFKIACLYRTSINTPDGLPGANISFTNEGDIELISKSTNPSGGVYIKADNTDITIESGSTSFGIVLSATNASILNETKIFKVASSVRSVFESDAILLGSENSAQSLIRGDEFKTGDTQWATGLQSAIDGLNVQIGILNGALVVLNTALATAGGLMTIPVAGAMAAGPVISAGAAATLVATSGVTAALGIVQSSLLAAKTAHVVNYDTIYLSIKAFTD